MKRLKKYMILLALLNHSFSGFSQQVTQFSQYLNNNFLVNPAATNVNDHLNLDFSFRQQETGNIKSINSSYLSIYGALYAPKPSQKMTHGFRDKKYIENSSAGAFSAEITPVIGAIISKDNFGLVERSTFHVSTGIHLPLNSRYTLSTGATIGSVLLNVSDDYFVLEENDLPFLNFVNGFNKQSFLDLGLGIWLYSDNLQVGYCLERLYSGNSLKAGNQETFKTNNQHFIQLGFRLPLNKDWQITPTILARINKMEPRGMDYSMKAIYKNRLWSTISLRKQSLLVFNLGVNVSPYLSVNYSYDHGSIDQGMESLSANELALEINLFH
jgi:type IX secretion system PorP/SprF family membrane protein